MRDPSAPVAAIIVNWNAAQLTLDVLAELERVEGPPLHFVVVDNGSRDDSVARLRRERPDLDLVETGENLGFAGANNIGIRHALAGGAYDWLLLINNDVEVEPGFLPPLLAACADPTVAASGPKILFQKPPDLIWAAGGRLRVRETVTREYGARQPDGPLWSRPAEVDYLTTCCLLVPRDAFERVGLFDPVYFVGVEDADWCRRARDVGLKLRYEPASRIWHMVAVSTGGSYTPIRTFHTGRSNALFARRHFGPLRMLAFLAANCLALPAAFLRELPRRNARAAVAKARGIWAGLRHPLREPPPRL
ncbi:MAG: glycosyltransferase family 2 protein [Thermoanaerobaculia bacterium]|nr:glycosyltransferase family 2 protein [Thermoanaerobaculia bacterium]